jgi:ferredoxin
MRIALYFLILFQILNSVSCFSPYTLKFATRSSGASSCSLCSSNPTDTDASNYIASGPEPEMYSAEWAKRRGMEPGYGGVWPGDPNIGTYKVTIISKKTNETFVQDVPKDRYFYYAFEQAGIDLPMENKPRMCRQGCCTICAVKIIEGKVKMDAPLGLLKELRNQGYALSCCAYPRSDIICELQDEDEMYIKQWSEGFEGGGIEWGGFLPDDD